MSPVSKPVLIWGGLALAVVVLALVVYKVTRGLRNKNPGNLKFASIGWQGETGSDGTFSIFDTAINGLRAAGITALNIGARHPDLHSFGNVWAPVKDGNSSTYGDDLATWIGVGANDPFPYSDPTMLAFLLHAITIRENGIAFYPAGDYEVSALQALQHKGLA